MSRHRLFTKNELASAFALLLPPREAEQTADSWFDTFAAPEAKDASGYYLADDQDWRVPTGRTPTLEIRGSAVRGDLRTGGYEQLRGQSVVQRVGFLLRLSEFHLRLLMLVSPELSERLTRFLGYTPSQADGVKSQMKLIVRAMGIPPAETD